MKYLLVLLIIVLSGCMPLASLIFGIKKPKYHTQEYIVKNAEKRALDQLDHYYFPSVTGLVNHFEVIDKAGLRNSINQVFVFNKEGHLYTPKDSIDCSSDYKSFIGNYPTGGEFSSEVTFNQLFGDSLVTSKPQRKSLDLNSELFVVTWASYAGRLNETNSKIWAEEIREKIEGQNIKAIFVNMDFHEDWERIDLKVKSGF